MVHGRWYVRRRKCPGGTDWTADLLYQHVPRKQLWRMHQSSASMNCIAVASSGDGDVLERTCRGLHGCKADHGERRATPLRKPKSRIVRTPPPHSVSDAKKADSKNIVNHL